MKKVIYILISVLMIACKSEHMGDCFQTAGSIIQQEVILSDFDKILVNRDIELIVKEGPVQEVIIETGKNLLNDVEVIVIAGRLTLTNKRSCNYVRDYGITKVYVTSPNIAEIRSSTQYDVRSDGVLTYPALSIISENFNAPDSFTIGNFYLQLNNNAFNVVFNNISNCYVFGNTNNLHITFASGGSRFEGENLIAQDVMFWNRSSNDMILNPQQSINGLISGTGDVICFNQPPIVDVLEHYKGRLIFK